MDIDWTSAESEFLAQKLQQSHDAFSTPAATARPATSKARSSNASAAEASRAAAGADKALNQLRDSMTTLERNNRASGRRHRAEVSKLSKGSSGTTSWESQNRMDDHTLTLANALGTFVSRVHESIVFLRDECRVALSNVKQHGVEKYPTDEVVTTLFPRTTELMDVVRDGFHQLMPLLTSTVRHNEPLSLLADIRAAVDAEISRAHDCSPEEYLKRWQRNTKARLRREATADSATTASTKSSGVETQRQADEAIERAMAHLAPSTITDKTTLPLEMLATPRSVLPVPPAKSPRMGMSAATLRRGPAGSKAQAVRQTSEQRQALHTTYDVKALMPERTTVRAESALSPAAVVAATMQQVARTPIAKRATPARQRSAGRSTSRPGSSPRSGSQTNASSATTAAASARSVETQEKPVAPEPPAAIAAAATEETSDMARAENANEAQDDARADEAAKVDSGDSTTKEQPEV